MRRNRTTASISRYLAASVLALSCGCHFKMTRGENPLYERPLARPMQLTGSGRTTIRVLPQVSIAGGKGLGCLRTQHFNCGPLSAESYDGKWYSSTALLFLVEALSSNPDYEVVIEPEHADEVSHLARVVVTELVEDVTKKQNEGKQVTHDVGFGLAMSLPYIAISAVPIVSPVSSLLMGFDYITGIPTSWDKQRIEGLVRVDVALIEAKSGAIEKSVSAPATFATEIRRVGDRSFGPGKFHRNASTPTEALRVAVFEAVKNLR